jgi:hypothetical protein
MATDGEGLLKSRTYTSAKSANPAQCHRPLIRFEESLISRTVD